VGARGAQGAQAHCADVPRQGGQGAQRADTALADAAPPAAAQLCAVPCTYLYRRVLRVLQRGARRETDPRTHDLPQRVAQLDSLARKVLSDLRLSQDPPPSSSLPASSHSSSSAAPPLSSLSDELPEEEDLGLAHRLRVDDSGRIMLGQEHLFRDLLHPLPVPGSWVWGNVMLYECVATRPPLSLSLFFLRLRQRL